MCVSVVGAEFRDFLELLLNGLVCVDRCIVRLVKIKPDCSSFEWVITMCAARPESSAGIGEFEFELEKVKLAISRTQCRRLWMAT